MTWSEEQVGVETAEDGDHDQSGKERRAAAAEQGRGGQLADADDALHPVERQGQEIDEVHQDVDRGDGQDPERQAARDRPLRIPDLLGRAVDRVPAVVGPEYGDERESERFEDGGEGRAGREQRMEIRASAP